MENAEQSLTAVHTHVGNNDDPEYEEFLARIQRRFDERTNLGANPLFTTTANADGDLFAVYLAEFTPPQTQFHNCHACRRFIELVGGLVVIDDTGETRSAMFDEEDAPELYKPSIRAILKRVRRSKVTGVFLSKEAVWGQPETGVWRHMSLRNSNVHRHALMTPSQAMAEKLQDHHNVARALAEFPAEHVATAEKLLKSDALYRSEKVLGPVEWLGKVHAARATATPGERRSNVLWRAIATAPAGFCHPRASMAGTLLEDIASGMDFATVSARFASKMSPLQYQRPTAAPSAGNVAQAEKLIASMGLAPSLQRRFARLEDLVTAWRPTERKPAADTGSVFGHLITKEKSSEHRVLEVPAQTMTWEKFARTVLPTAEQIEVMTPSYGSYSALVTAVNPDAPPILQWDLEGQRNPVSWYVYMSGTSASQWRLNPGVFAKVNAITLQPNMWHTPERFEHQGKSVFLVIDGARDTVNCSSALFPEILKAELREVRSTIEAYSRSRKLEGELEASACGLRLQNGAWQPATVRVTSGDQKSLYRLDRWD